MIKYFCDVCKKEITTHNSTCGIFKIDSRIVKVEVLNRMDGTVNKGNICKHCLLDAFYKLDDRKRKPVRLPILPHPRKNTTEQPQQ